VHHDPGRTRISVFCLARVIALGYTRDHRFVDFILFCTVCKYFTNEDRSTF